MSTEVSSDSTKARTAVSQFWTRPLMSVAEGFGQADLPLNLHSTAVGVSEWFCSETEVSTTQN